MSFYLRPPQLWCAAGVDLTGWRTGGQESEPPKALPSGSDPLQAEENDGGKKSNHNSPEKRKVSLVGDDRLSVAPGEWEAIGEHFGCVHFGVQFCWTEYHN